MKTQTVNLRTSPDENDILKQAAEKLSQQTGEKENISKTIIEAVKQFKDKDPKPKIEYYFKAVLYRDLCGLHSRALLFLQKVAEDFKTLELGLITNKDISEIGAGNFTDIKSRYYQKIESNISKLELSSELIKENMRAGVDETYFVFQKQTENNLTNFNGASYVSEKHYPQLSVSNFTVKDGIITFSDENKEFLKNEYCTVYIQNPAQEKFIKLQDETLKGLQELKKMLIENNVGSLFSSSGDVGLFDEGREDVIIGDPEFVEFIMIT